MVTDEERDYMYREYGKDPQMRCNIGIRRRMAPLMDNSLRRRELPNSLLDPEHLNTLEHVILPAFLPRQRREKHSPLKDVAGMLHSFSYAAHTSLLDFTRERPDDLQTLEPWARAWEVWVSSEFLREYLETASDAPFLPDDEDQLETLLDAFFLDKAFYELNYELNNRPDWLHIPLQGILELAKTPLQDSKP